MFNLIILFIISCIVLLIIRILKQQKPVQEKKEVLTDEFDNPDHFMVAAVYNGALENKPEERETLDLTCTWIDDKMIAIPLRTLPPSLKKFKKLKQLILTYNRLEALPKEIGELSELKLLDLKSNYFKIFPEEILPLKKLETLIIARCSIKQIPDSIGLLENLTTLEIDEFMFAHIPHAIHTLPKLKKITVWCSMNNALKEQNIREALPKRCEVKIEVW